MSKKKSKKKRHAKSQSSSKPNQSSVTKGKLAAQKDAERAVEDTTTPDVNEQEFTTEVVEESEEPVPRHPINQRAIAIALVAVIVILLLAIWYFVSSYNTTKTAEQSKSQDSLLQVKPSDENSLQSTGSSSLNPQSTGNPGQDSTSAQQLQPQSTTTPDQANQ